MESLEQLWRSTVLTKEVIMKKLIKTPKSAMDIGHDLSKALPQGRDQNPTLSSDSTLISERE